MRKSFKKIFSFLTAATLTAGALSLAACGTPFTPVKDKDEGTAVESNGGFVVSTKDYYYFINGVESNQSDNTYGKVDKGALMRISKKDVNAKKNTAETIIPSLMVTGDTSTAAGICIYGGRIYYATPTNVKDTTGQVQRDYLDFRSAKLDGSDVKFYFRVSNNSMEYRFVEVNEIVYVMYLDGTTIHSYNTQSGADTVLAESVGKAVFDKSDKENATVYYTMSVTDGADSDTPYPSADYNQVYRVRADATEAPYEYKWDTEWLEEHNEGKAPYVNLGELVLDGIGATNPITQFNRHAEAHKDAIPRIGYTYTLQEYSNGGIYFVRKLISTPGSSTVGASGELYYLPESVVNLETSDSITNNNKLDTVASATNATKASGTALFYIEEGVHHYLYENDGYIYRATVNADGTNAEEVEIAYGANSATLIALDRTSSETYKYLYYTISNQSGRSVHRAVYNGTPRDYGNLQFGDTKQELYAPVKVLDVQHATGWYDYEILDGTLFYANSEAIGSNSYNYVYTIDLKNKDGSLMNNLEIKEFNDKYEEINGSDGYLNKEASDKVSSNYANAARYYFYTGSTEQFDENIRFSVEEGGRKDTYLYTQEEQDAFRLYAKGELTEKDSEGKDKVRFVDADGNSYRTLAYFTTFIGKTNEADDESMANHWKTTLRNYELPATEDEGLAWWAWTLIGVGIGVVVAAAVLVPVLVIRKKKKAQANDKPEKMLVDTTDDKTLDVYGEGENAEAEEARVEEAPAEAEAEIAEPETAEAPVETAEEAVPAEEPVREEPAGEPVEASETPAEEPEATEETEAPKE